MNSVLPVCMRFFKRLIVSCQASEGDAFRDAGSMARFAKAAADGGAAGIRANGAEDIRAIRQAVQLPIIGIQKTVQADGRILITASFDDARELAAAGADVIALDCTTRGQRYGAVERLQRIKAELGLPVMADIATLEEALAAASAGADLIATTLRGYTPETESVRAFQPAFVAELADRLELPVVAEGRIATPEQARQSIRAGAFAVVVGTAITRPQDITARFVRALEMESPTAQHFLAIDLGGTNTKFGIVSQDGKLVRESVLPTPPGGGRDVLLGHLKRVATRCLDLAREAGVSPAALGVATAGWVDPHTGRVVYASETLPGWTGTPIADELHTATGLPVAVENDANALAVAEKHFGLARHLDHFVSITLGTGVGGGCYVNGRLNHGAHFVANGLGHIPIQREGRTCTCGLKGCLEEYANAAALLRYAGEEFGSAEDVVRAANSGHPTAQRAMSTYAAHLATGVIAIAHLLDPEMVIISGGLAQNNPALLTELEQHLAGKTIASQQRRLRIRISELGYYGGVLGAAAVAMETLQHPSEP